MISGGVALAGGEVDDAAARPAGSAAAVSASTSGSTSLRAGPGRSARSDLDVEVPGVGEHRAVLHALEVLAAQDVARARSR